MTYNCDAFYNDYLKLGYSLAFILASSFHQARSYDFLLALNIVEHGFSIVVHYSDTLFIA